MRIGSKVMLIKDYSSESIQWCLRNGIRAPEKDFVYTISSLEENADPNRLFVDGIRLKEYKSRILFNKNDWREVEPASLKAADQDLEIQEHIIHKRVRDKSPSWTSNFHFKES